MTQLGKNVAGYFLQDVLGAGGFGTVYRARKESSPDRALKILNPDLLDSPQAIARFEREVQTVRALQHRCSVDVYESGRLPDGSPFFVMELLDGEELSDAIARDGCVALAEVIRVLRPICDLLDATHQRGVVHRDIKASNVFLCRDGRVVLLDFGIAKMVGVSGMTLTLSQQVVGSPTAMSPEQLGGGLVSPRTDVYGLGAIAFHMLTARVAFRNESTVVMEHMHRHAQRERPSVNAAVPTDLDSVVVKAMAIDPLARQRSALEFFYEFEEAVLGRHGVPESSVQALVAFLKVGPCGEDPSLASQGVKSATAAHQRFLEAGFELVSAHSTARAYACRLHNDPRDAAAKEVVAQIEADFHRDAPHGSVLHTNTGEVLVMGRKIVGGAALTPKRQERNNG